MSLLTTYERQAVLLGEERAHENEQARERALNRAPSHVLESLDRAGKLKGRMEPRASNNGWQELLFSDYATTAVVSNSTTEAGFSTTTKIPTIPTSGPGSWQVGKTFRWTVFFDWSTVITTPGTLTLRLRQNTIAGTAMATSGAFAPDPTAASTNVSGMVEFYTVVYSLGTSGTTKTMGRVGWNDFDDASATSIIGNLNMNLIPVSAPATVTTDTVTSAMTLLPTAQAGVATAGTNVTTHIALLESLN
jgi:hypothetical protein